MITTFVFGWGREYLTEESYLQSPSGYSYESNFAQTLLAGSYMFRPNEIETFYFFKSEGELLMIIF